MTNVQLNESGDYTLGELDNICIALEVFISDANNAEQKHEDLLASLSSFIHR